MDGKGRVFDNIFVERLWRAVNGGVKVSHLAGGESRGGVPAGLSDGG